MRRVFVFLLVVLLAGGMLFPQRLKVRLPKIIISQPNQNTVWCTGKTYTITWKIIDPMDKRVSINLVHWPLMRWNARQRGYNISSGTSNNGKFYYKVPGSVKAGKYMVTITTLDGKVKANSPAFNLKNCLIAIKPQMDVLLKMEVLKPNSGSFWDPGKKYTIKWKTNAIGLINIQLYTYNKKYVRTIATAPKLPKGSQYSWTVPHTVKTGKYKIRVATLNNKVQGFSQKFTIRMYNWQQVKK